MRALLAQLAPLSSEPTANLRHLTAALAEHADADLAIFPELYLAGYDLGRVSDDALDPHGEELRAVAAAAAETETAIVVGFAERTRAGGVANSVALIDARGRLVGVYRKTHLFGAERNVFTAGHSLLLAELGDVVVGPLVCFDIEFPEPARELARAGADVLVTVSANMEPFYGDHLLLGRARALENRRPHLYVNRVGRQSGLQFVGGSRAIGADGTVLFERADDGEHVDVVDVDDVGEAVVADARLEYLNLTRGPLPVVRRIGAAYSDVAGATL